MRRIKAYLQRQAPGAGCQPAASAFARLARTHSGELACMPPAPRRQPLATRSRARLRPSAGPASRQARRLAGGEQASSTDEVHVRPPAAAAAGGLRGANCYYLLTRAASEETRHQVLEGARLPAAPGGATACSTRSAHPCPRLCSAPQTPAQPPAPHLPLPATPAPAGPSPGRLYWRRRSSCTAGRSRYLPGASTHARP